MLKLERSSVEIQIGFFKVRKDKEIICFNTEKDYDKQIYNLTLKNNLSKLGNLIDITV